MNPLQRALIEKTGHDFGFEYVAQSDANSIRIASALHPAQLIVSMIGDDYRVAVHKGPGLLLPELVRDFVVENGSFNCGSINVLATLLKRAASLARALPNSAHLAFEEEVEKELNKQTGSILSTEVERMVRQRIGQDTFRKAMLDYWGGACAVTGVSLPEVLRASHAKPWAECTSDAERLDVFNGFLLSANLDALFDRGLVSFDDTGKLLLSERIGIEESAKLGLDEPKALRWVAEEHQGYLAWHRQNLFE